MEIFKTLQQYKEHAEAQGLIVYAIALKGSQNYNLDDKDSDIDANLVFIPTPQQLRTNKKYKYSFDTGDVVCHNIYDFATIVAKGNPQWVEVCNTEYVIGDLSLFKHYKLNPSALKGMMMEKVYAFDKLYPSSKKDIEKYGYSPKQLHHIIRLYDLLEAGGKNLKYTGSRREWLLGIKRGSVNKEEAIALMKEYTSKLQDIYEAKKLKYSQQVVDFNTIDSILIDYYKKFK